MATDYCSTCPDARSNNTKTHRRPSLYASIRLARFVYQVRERLKCRAQRNSQGKEGVDFSPKSLQAQAQRDLNNNEASLETRAGERTPATKRLRIDVPNLLAHLDHHVSEGEPKTSIVATHDQLFLGYNARRVTRFKGIDELRHIYDLTTLLLAQVARFSCRAASQGWPSELWALLSGAVDYQKSIANLDHILRCLQQAALEALVYHGLKSLVEDTQEWHQHWLQERQLNHGWFFEWPNGRRPLNTTWPWNVRPSLVVLWGVCWMFYDNSTRSAQQLRQQLKNEEVASSLWTRHTPQSATSSQRKPQRPKTFQIFYFD
ncbi:MAG: hypothetical protein Q9225_005284 [Loekoesia sp. 1 TL-2023]